MTSFIYFPFHVKNFGLIYLVCLSFGLMTFKGDINYKQVLEIAFRLETYRNQLGRFAAFTRIVRGVVPLSVSRGRANG